MRAIGALRAFRPERRGNSTTFRSSLMTIARNFVIDEARTAGKQRRSTRQQRNSD
jgi:DNA-directed RNA polymerase specialized sigma24 family protein